MGMKGGDGKGTKNEGRKGKAEVIKKMGKGKGEVEGGVGRVGGVKGKRWWGKGDGREEGGVSEGKEGWGETGRE